MVEAIFKNAPLDEAECQEENEHCNLVCHNNSDASILTNAPAGYIKITKTTKRNTELTCLDRLDSSLATDGQGQSGRSSRTWWSL